MNFRKNGKGYDLVTNKKGNIRFYLFKTKVPSITLACLICLQDKRLHGSSMYNLLKGWVNE